MRIVVDLLGYTGGRGGTETYARELLRRLPDRVPEADWVALANDVGAERVEAFFPGTVRVSRSVRDGKVGWAAGEVFLAERTARRVGGDLLWTPQNFGPVVRGMPRVATIHDVIYDEVRGAAAERISRGVTSWLMGRSARTADAVITISQAARRSIIERLKVDPSRIRVVHNGASAPPLQPGPDAPSAWEIPGRRSVVLSVGNRMPHKNFDGLLRAIAAIDPSRRPYTVIPGADPSSDPLRPLIETLGLQADVLLPGWVSDAELEALYAVADVYVCPSLAEGFGLPIIDAMARGCRVVAHDIPVLREVGGDVATYADARRPSALAEAILGATGTPPSVAERSRAAAHAATFSWDSAAAETAEVLTETCTSARR
ncbi:glycosyltransferase family 4 protein [Microbacterium sp. NPDC078428]|uniref:Glycosyltransferase family 1 protein n=1 Tax=Microbacterium limosum TaxID=3079935 RepID=A0AAU0MF26_9MICO|nr:glycosyltransferase family 1 protein [Microbacterium sp. Y20]WOQ68814.1 glycosyltransferase family 1 protein [Microbacterium sp. Y20]